jgi:anthranilate 1,2-dioxygenase large subunit/terephthalate 1,2-dioxygenase oxygenase component alpha subunit
MDQPIQDPHSTGVAFPDWPPGLTRVPYWVYRDQAVAQAEQARVFEGPCWNYLCLEADIPNTGDFRTSFMGAMPVVVVRTEDGSIAAFENRCVHRGALICLDDCGSVKDFHCVYHAWRYDLRGNLTSIAFRRGVNGQGGMPEGFRMEDHRPRAVRVTTLCGLVFGTLSDAAPPIEDYIGPAITGRIRRVLRAPIEVLGRFTQPLPNNWKLYMENVRDTYHASLLHLFFTTFRITRLSSGGGVLVSDNGVGHASATRGDPPRHDTSYAGIRSDDAEFKLIDPSFMNARNEFGDDIQLQILTVFPGFVLQQINNCLAIRQTLPTGVGTMDLNWTYIGFADDPPDLRAMRLRQANLVGPAGYVSLEDGAVGGFVQRGIASADDILSVVEMGGHDAESQETRATEASVRGFWKAYRGFMGL